MIARWIIFAYILKIHLKSITPQHHHHHHHHYYDDTLQHYDEEDDPDESDESSSEYITRRRAKHRRIADSEECYCTCDACFSREGPKPCCSEFCKYCHTNTGISNQDQYGNQEQKVVFVPFPYPLIVPNNAQNDDANTEQQQLETTTTRKKLDTTIKPTEPDSPITVKSKKPGSARTKLLSKSVEVDTLSRHRQMKQLNPAVKRTRPTWVPKYGIVPIPDHLAAKLMTQLTEVRALKAKRL